MFGGECVQGPDHVDAVVGVWVWCGDGGFPEGCSFLPVFAAKPGALFVADLPDDGGAQVGAEGVGVGEVVSFRHDTNEGVVGDVVGVVVVATEDRGEFGRCGDEFFVEARHFSVVGLFCCVHLPLPDV